MVPRDRLFVSLSVHQALLFRRIHKSARYECFDIIQKGRCKLRTIFMQLAIQRRALYFAAWKAAIALQSVGFYGMWLA